MKNISPVFPQWGPYGKKYAGISKITDVKDYSAARFDFITVPGVMGFDIRVPNVTVPSAYHPWECSPNYDYYSFRHELEWKDVVFSDVSYSRIDDDSILVRTQFVNNTDDIKNFVLNYFSSLELPIKKAFKARLPEKCDFIKASKYSSFNYAVRRPWDDQNADAMKKGVFPDSRFTFGEGLGDRAEKWHMPYKVFLPFGAEKGDSVKYDISLKNSYKDACLVVRYRSSAIKYVQGKMVGVSYVKSDDTAVFDVCGKQLVLPASDSMAYACLDLGKLDAGRFDLSLVSEGTGACEFDFFALCEKEDSGIVTEYEEKQEEPNYIPKDTVTKCENGYSVCAQYKDCEENFYLRVFDNNTRFRHVSTGCLEDCMSSRMSNADESFDDLTESFTGSFNRKHSDDGFYLNAISHTIFVSPHSSAVRYAVLSSKPHEDKSDEEYESIYLKRRSNAVKLSLNGDGEKYNFSVSLLNAALLTNVVYPIYKHGEYIIHHTPGKRWDCLYTWDSGFIGLGMNEIAPDFASYILDTYLSEESNKDYAFVHHGSPVPVQIYQALEMLQKSHSKTDVLSYYERLRLYYRFLCGKIRGSTTARFKTGLLTSYDYFYSTSGMDDYPAQVFMMKEENRQCAAPVITTAQVIRFAKILYMLADKKGIESDKEEYKKDIERLTAALEKYSWDEESGYYSYVLHDENGEYKEKYTTESGENKNKGLDGIYPLISGVCDERQEAAILSHLKNEKEMLSPYGISAVDQSASYYRVNGYWNGHIWFAHQWFIWKSMLDLNDGDFAFEIAKRALNIWKREAEKTYFTFEMVNVVTGSGGWFHNFGGLSAPILLWLKAYYAPGTLNAGFDTYIDSYSFENDDTQFIAHLTSYKDGKSSLVVCMSDKADYSITLDGKQAKYKKRTDGAFEIEIDSKLGEKHIIEIKTL